MLNKIFKLRKEDNEFKKDPFKYKINSQKQWFIGLDYKNMPIYFDLTSPKILNYVGGMGSGKSLSVTYSLGTYLAGNYNSMVTIIDLTVTSGEDFDKFNNNFFAKLNSIEQCKNYLNFLYCEMISRKNNPHKDFSSIITVIEESPYFLNHFENTLQFINGQMEFSQKDLLIFKKLLNESYKYNIYFIMSGQIFSKHSHKLINPYHLVFKIHSEKDSLDLINSNLPYLLTKNGICYNEKKLKLTFPYLDKNIYKKYFKKEKEIMSAILTEALFLYNFNLKKMANDMVIGLPIIPEIHEVTETTPQMIELADILNQILIKKNE